MLQQRRGPEPEPRPAGPSGLGPAHPQCCLPAKVLATNQHPKVLWETNPGLWLNVYRLAYQAGGADNDDFIIRNLPLFLADSARARLEHLPSNAIQSWADLKEIFVGNFQGMYKRPGNPWDLKNCHQKASETLWVHPTLLPVVQRAP